MKKSEIIENHCISILTSVYKHELANGYGKLGYTDIERLSGVPNQTVWELINEAADCGEHSRLACIATKYGFIFKATPRKKCKLSVVKCPI